MVVATLDTDDHPMYLEWAGASIVPVDATEYLTAYVKFDSSTSANDLSTCIVSVYACASGHEYVPRQSGIVSSMKSSYAHDIS